MLTRLDEENPETYSEGNMVVYCTNTFRHMYKCKIALEPESHGPSPCHDLSIVVSDPQTHPKSLTHHHTKFREWPFSKPKQIRYFEKITTMPSENETGVAGCDYYGDSVR